MAGYTPIPLQPQPNYGVPGNNIADTIMQDIMSYGQQPGAGVLASNQVPAADTGSSGFWSMDSAFGNAKTGTSGWAPTALSAGQGLFNAYMGMKQYGLMKDQLAENKRQFNLNYENQRTLTNSQLRDRQAARVASNPSAYQSVGQYMKQNGV